MTKLYRQHNRVIANYSHYHYRHPINLSLYCLHPARYLRKYQNRLYTNQIKTIVREQNLQIFSLLTGLFFYTFARTVFRHLIHALFMNIIMTIFTLEALLENTGKQFSAKTTNSRKCIRVYDKCVRNVLLDLSKDWRVFSGSFARKQ